MARTTVVAQQSESRVVAPESYVREQWTVNDGLPVNSINHIIQTRQGYLWLATFDGLVRFDGVRFTVYNTANTPGLTSNRIVAVAEAPDGALLVVAERQDVVLRFDGRRATPFALTGAERGDVVTALIPDPATNTVFAAAGTGLWAIRSGTNGQITERVMRGALNALLRRNDGTLWGGTPNGLYRIDGSAPGPVGAGSAFDTANVTAIAEDSTGSLWVSTQDAVWVERGGKFTRLLPRGKSPAGIYAIHLSLATGRAFAIATSGVHPLSPDAIGPALSDGLARGDSTLAFWNMMGAELSNLAAGRAAMGAATRTILPRVRAFVVDREGTIWVATLEGLHRLKPRLFTVYSVPEGLAMGNVYPLYADRAGQVWAGTWGNGFSRIETTTGRITSFPVSRGYPAHVNSFMEDENGRLLVAGGSDVLACTRPAVTCRPAFESGHSPGQAFALYLTRDNTLWAGTTTGVFRVINGRLEHMRPPVDASSAPVRAFLETRDGAVWMGTNGAGLFRFHDGAFTRVGVAEGLPTELIRSLYQDADGWLWVGTEGRGLVRLDPAAADRKIVRIGSADGLFDDVIHQILEDDVGRLWMSTNRGIFWVRREELNAFANGSLTRVHSTSYGERDGLRNREANGGVYPAGAKTPDGRLWFPTQDGVAVVDPSRVGERRDPPPVVVEQVVANGEALALDSGRVTVAVGQRDVQIDFTALAYLEPKNIRFRYRLDGYDGDWVDAGNRRTAFYTRLTPGTHRFRVNATDASGNWSEPGASIVVHVLPRVHETTAFRVAMAAALALALFGGFRLRVAQLHSRSRALERTVAERTATVRERERQLAEQNARLEAQAVELTSLDHAKTRFFANVSHELRTPLTLIIGPLDDLRTQAKGDDRSQRWVDIASNNARRLLRLVNQILDVAKLDAKQMRLTRQSLDVAAFARGVAAVFAPVAERKGIRMTVETPDALVGAFDADAIEKTLTNLLSNGIKFTPNGGAVELSVSRESNSATMIVRDSGPGIPSEHLRHVFERFYQVDEATTRTQPGTGIGLSLTKELVELHGGTIGVTSDSTGTTFTVIIPLGDDTPSRVAPGAIPALAPVPLVTAEHDGGPTAGDNGSDARGDEERADIPTVLVVDDSADLRHYIREHLEPEFNVIEGSDGAAGIALAREHIPDVVISDVMMPGTDGHELVRALRASRETDFLPIVLLTAQAEDEQKIAGLQRGADDYLVKPFEMRELQARVRNLIESRRRLRDRFLIPPSPETLTSPTRGLPPADQQFAERIRIAIHERHSDPTFGVAELANAVSQDRSHLFRRVREVFGESPSELIRRVRLEEAARLLEGADMNVASVAYAVGFNSVAGFYRAFQAAYGATPAAYRERGARV
jgi:signal transduction histidine kinase/ligand-binding sensor domain-containing protein/DNA-binding response OmpR family regulator